MQSENATLAPQFDLPEQEQAAAALGMWIFLVTELLFFGVLFAGYVILRWSNPLAFAIASKHTVVSIGTANTTILLTSSLCMAMSVRSAKLGKMRKVTHWLWGTALFGLLFLGLKLFEYYLDYQDHLVPLVNFHFTGSHAHAIEQFFFLYFVMTLFHALHLTVGVCLVLFMIHLNRSGRFGCDYFTPVEITGLYWHFVDIVWIFLYPLIYLGGRS